MKIVHLALIVISFSAPLYAADLSGTSPWGAMTTGINQGLQNAYQIQQMRLMEEQRQAIEQQRIMMEEERRRMEQQKLNNFQKSTVQTGDVFGYMDANVPGWRQLDTDPGFIQWLKEPIPNTRYTKLQILRAAVAERNGPELAQFFIEYKATLGR